MSSDKKRTNRTGILVVIISTVVVVAMTLISQVVTLMNRPSPSTAFNSNAPTSTASPLPSPTKPVASQTPSSQLITPTSTEEMNWAISFQYHFPSGYWLEGKHEYTLEMSCPLTAPDLQNRNGKWTNSFNVSSYAPSLAGDVYLRPEGIGSIALFRQPLTTISATQTTTAIVSVAGLTYVQADWYSKNCMATIQPDNGAIISLLPEVPYQP